MKTILITGALGLIGSKCAEEFLKIGAPIRFEQLASEFLKRPWFVRYAHLKPN